MVSWQERLKLRDDFQQRWPFQAVENMTLEQYTGVKSKDTFTFWLESKTENLISIWGGSAYKFGIFKGIVSDMFIDHFLSKNFNQLFNKDIEIIEKRILDEVEKNRNIFPKDFDSMFKWLNDRNVMSNYKDIDFLERAFEGLARNIRKGEILNLATTELKKNYNLFEEKSVKEFFYVKDKSIEEFKEVEFDLPYTEIKYENTINRTTGIANPRQLERVPAGSEFDFKIVYNIEKIEDLKEDMENILLMIDVLEDDYLGGHGTRGYGRIKFKDFSIDIKTYTEENDKEIVAIKKEIDNFRKELESKVE